VLVVDEGHLAEQAAALDGLEDLVAERERHAAFLDDVHKIAGIAFLEDDAARGEALEVVGIAEEIDRPGLAHWLLPPRNDMTCHDGRGFAPLGQRLGTSIPSPYPRRRAAARQRRSGGRFRATAAIAGPGRRAIGRRCAG